MPQFPMEVPDSRYFEKLIPCREGCPVHTDGRGYVQAVAQGEYELAYRIARAPNPFASICGRVCGAPCERVCRRGLIDEPVSIRAIKRFVTERFGVEVEEDLKHTLSMSTAPGTDTPKGDLQKVAVIGAGVAGLTAAHDLARLGYRVTVFEEEKAPGGLLVTGVPLFRLPRDVVQREIDAIKLLGVEIRCNVKVGTTVTLPELKAQGYEAALLAVGLQKSRTLDLPGAGLAGVRGGLDFLRDFNDARPVQPMGRVIVIGGGNVAYDVARSALRVPGTTSVTMAVLEALHEMPADKVEIHEGAEEGIELRNRVGPVRFVEGKPGSVGGLELRRVSRVFDENRRFAPELVPGSEFTIEGDTVLVSVGQAGDTGFVTGVAELQLGRGGTIIADRATGKTSIPWLFAAGDAALGPGLFIDAVAQGSRAAIAIDTYLLGKERPKPLLELGFITEANRESLVPGWMDIPRRPPPGAPIAARKAASDYPIEQVFSEEQARAEGARCLSCAVETVFDGSLCIQCGGCADVCPTWCLRLVSLEEIGLDKGGAVGGSAIIKDEDRCIRCALCATRCPTHAITMERFCGFEPWEPLVELKARGKAA